MNPICLHKECVADAQLEQSWDFFLSGSCRWTKVVSLLEVHLSKGGKALVEASSSSGPMRPATHFCPRPKSVPRIPIWVLRKSSHYVQIKKVILFKICLWYCSVSSQEETPYKKGSHLSPSASSKVHPHGGTGRWSEPEWALPKGLLFTKEADWVSPEGQWGLVGIVLCVASDSSAWRMSRSIWPDLLVSWITDLRKLFMEN